VAGEEGGHTEWLVKFEDEEEVRRCRAGCKHRQRDRMLAGISGGRARGKSAVGSSVTAPRAKNPPAPALPALPACLPALPAAPVG
jgi:hypothetical protein